MIGTNDTDDLVDWERRTIDGQTVYELEYSKPVREPTTPSKPLFGAGSGGTVPHQERTITLPDGEEIPIAEAAFEADGTTLRVWRENPSIVSRLRRYLPW